MSTDYKAIAAAVTPEMLIKYAKFPKHRGQRGEEDYPELAAAVAEYELAVRGRALEWGTLKVIALKHGVAPSSIRARFVRKLARLEKQACK
jgi:hypothetical protein